MANGILDERLQDESGNQAIDGIVLDAILDRQPVGEANSLDVEVRFDSDDLFAERDLTRALSQRRAKDRRELSNHATRGDGRIVCELGHGSKGVEQEVRLKLRLEIVQTRSSERCLEPSGLALSLREGAPHERELRGRNDDGIARDVEVGVEHEHRRE